MAKNIGKSEEIENESAHYFHEYMLQKNQYHKEQTEYIDLIKKIIRNPRNKDYKAYIYLSYLSEQGIIKEELPEHYIKKMIEQMIKNNDFEKRIRDYMKATSEIKEISVDYYLLQKFIIKKSSTNNFAKEFENRNNLEKIIGKEVTVPTALMRFKLGKNFYYTMKREEGQKLTDLINWNYKLDNIYEKILKIIAKIHVLMPLSEEKYDFDEKLREKSIKLGLNDVTGKSAGPIINILKNSNNWCYNKDSGTDNWMLTKDNKIICLDTEDKGIVPYAVDLANFLNCIPYLLFEERIKKVEDYFEEVNKLADENGLKDRRITDKDKFMREYFNAVIYRAIANSGYLFSKNVVGVRKVANTGIKMINYMVQEGVVANEDKENYLKIRRGLENTLISTIV